MSPTLLLLSALLAPTPPTARLEGQLVSRGVRAPLVGLILRIAPGDRETFSDGDGRFTIELPPATYTVAIDDPSVAPFSATVTLRAGETTRVQWGLTRRDDVTDAVVVGRRTRPDPRTRLTADELTRVAGTLGDPLRVLQSLPGVGVISTLVPYPVIRGAPPGDATYRLDGATVPLLFHGLVGNSVFHPRLIDRVDFYPGAAPLRYGRSVAGVVDAVVKTPTAPDWIADLDVNALQAGALVSAPFDDGDGQIALAGRSSFAEPLIGLFSEGVILDFWDYQGLVEHRLPGGGRLRLLVFGAADDVRPGATARRDTVSFHRLVARYRQPIGDRGTIVAGLELGRDRLVTPTSSDDAGPGADTTDLDEWLARPYFIWTHAIDPRLTTTVGLDVLIRQAENRGANLPGSIDDFAPQRPAISLGVGVYTTVRWRPATSLTLEPGVRLDAWRRANGTTWTADPRLVARWRVAEGTTLVAQAGVAHAPQRFFVPVPGLGEIETDVPPIEAWQGSLGVEQALGARWSLQATAYGRAVENLAHIDIDFAPGDERPTSFGLEVEAAGRGMGLEIMLRRRASGRVFGWLAYTLQRNERRPRPEARWSASPFDQTHLLTGVMSWRFARGWSLGARLHHHTGRPIFDGAEQRLPAYTQLDLRLDKGWVFDAWVMDLYVDVVNASFATEVLSEDEFGTQERLRFILPSVGLHAAF